MNLLSERVRKDLKILPEVTRKVTPEITLGRYESVEVSTARPRNPLERERMALPVMVKCQNPTPLTKSNVTIVKFDVVQGWEGLNKLALEFEWDHEKDKINQKKHGVSFEEAKTIFRDPFSITINDPKHSLNEQRYIDIGLSDKLRLLVVIYTERGSKIRLISSRKAILKEQQIYEQSSY